MKATTEQLVSALRVLSVQIESEDGVANAVVAEAADRITALANLVAQHIKETKEDTEQMQTACETMAAATEKIRQLRERIKRLEEFASRFLNPDDLGWAIGKYDRDEAREALGRERVESKVKEAKP